MKEKKIQYCKEVKAFFVSIVIIMAFGLDGNPDSQTWQEADQRAAPLMCH